MWMVRGLWVAAVVGTISCLFMLFHLSPPSSNHEAVPDGCSQHAKECGHTQAQQHGPRRQPVGSDYFGTAGEEIIKEMKAANIENYLKYLTSQGHMAGTKQDLEQAEYLKKLWLHQGLDQVFLKPYNVQLSHPDISKPNRVYLLDENDQVKFTSSIMEEPLDGVDYDDSIPPAFLAFAPAGSVLAEELVYVNYGLYEDFVTVKAAGVSVAGRLVIAKFGRGFRGDKVKNAQHFNASGIILYTDPKDFHPDSDSGGASYPHSLWLPGSGIQRGTILVHDGDPTTPHYPALEGTFRLPEELTDVPRIPAHTISYNDARKLLVNMGGEEVPPAWRGGLNITYKMGPQLLRLGWKVKLEVNNVKRVVPTYNVIGVIRGAEEPDRYVITGNHRDSWTFGSLDPSSGTAVMMEMIRAFTHLKASGWHPRRSLVFISWGAGEFGFFGATEWVEEHVKVLQTRAVAYINVDLAIISTYNLEISASPLMHKIIKEATKRTPPPDPSLGFTSLWDHWTTRPRPESPHLVGLTLASLSDHFPFYQRTGVPTCKMHWERNFGEFRWTDYSLYHSTYEDFDAMKNILDPQFRYHLTLGHLWALMGIGLADAQILPMDPTDETVMLRRMLTDLHHQYGPVLAQQNISLRHLEDVIDEFDETAAALNGRLNNLTDVTSLEARQLNDQLLLIEKCFIDDHGGPRRPHMKNMMFGTSEFDQYDGWAAPGVREALLTAARQPTDSAWRSVRQQLSVLHYVIHSAVLAMKDLRL